MSTTQPRVSFSFYAAIIKEDSLPSCNDLQPFSKVSDLRTGNIAYRPYITFEKNYWLLNGRYKFRTNDNTSMHVGVMSQSLSGADRHFVTPPALTVDFFNVHSVTNLVLYFSQQSLDYCDSITITYYDPYGTLIRSDNYNPTGYEFATNQAVEGFRRIVITFYSTNKPYRFLRLTGIEYGDVIRFEGNDIKAMTLVEQVDPISTQLPINSLDLSIFSTDEQFSMINPSGDYAGLQYHQPLVIYTIVDGDLIYMGLHYLEDWENKSENEITFSAVNAIGVLDTLPYMGGIWGPGQITLLQLLTEMFSDVNILFEVDPELHNVTIAGWIPICNYREALQQIAFASGAYVVCARSGMISVRKGIDFDEISTPNFIITDAEKGIDQSLTLKSLVTGIELTEHNYVLNTIESELYKQTLGIGTHPIKFSQPAHDLQITGGVIRESGANYAIVEVGTPGEVIITGQGYTDTTKIHSKYKVLDIDVKANVISINDATLVNSSNAEETLFRLGKYYDGRYLQKAKLFAPLAEVGGTVKVDTLYSQKIQGIIEKMDSDLFNGFVSNTEIVGVVA